MLNSNEMKARGYDSDAIARQLRREEAVGKAGPLIAEIESAFAGVPRPLITVSVAIGLDDEWHLSEERAKELRALDPEENWMNLDDETLEEFVYHFPFMDSPAWHFYLPAYMRDCLRNFPGPCDTSVNAHCQEEQNLTCFREPQRDLVRRFVAFCDYRESD